VIQLPPEAVRDTVAAVFRQPAFDRSLRHTLWNRFTTWFGDLLDRFSRAVGESPLAYWSARVLLVLAALLILGRIGYVLWARRQAADPHRAGGVGGARGGAGDPWVLAQQEAAAGRYTEAAHLLYQGLLQALAGRERLRLHPSKTVGDYARELRTRSSSAFGGFREFARSYETVVYGLQYCDRERYERLHALAATLAGPRG
jgi:hypothetical protein